MASEQWKTKKIDSLYANFSIEKNYGIRVMERRVLPGGPPMFEPWMLPEKENSIGIIDFRARKMTGCSNLWTRDSMNILSLVESGLMPDF